MERDLLLPQHRARAAVRKQTPGSIEAAARSTPALARKPCSVESATRSTPARIRIMSVPARFLDRAAGSYQRAGKSGEAFTWLCLTRLSPNRCLAGGAASAATNRPRFAQRTIEFGEPILWRAWEASSKPDALFFRSA